jgi:hypothetical protein
VLNHTGKLMWTELSAGRSPIETARALSLAYGVSIETALADVTTALAGWREGGLLNPSITLAPVPIPAAPAGKIFPVYSKFTYKMLGRVFKVWYSSRMLECFSHTRLAGSVFTLGGAEREFGLVEDDGVYRLFVDRVETANSSKAEDIPSCFNLGLAELFFPGAGWLAAAHGSAVSRDGRAVLMPAFCGSGKSTLTAALVKHGYQYFSDDIAPITAGPVPRVVPIPIDICLKSGSWAPLIPYYPELENDAKIQCAGGRAARYITPPESSLAQEPQPIGWIVFPSYRPGATARLIPLTPLQTLSNLATSQSAINQGGETLRGVLDWIRATPSYIFELDSLEEAIAEFATLWRR